MPRDINQRLGALNARRRGTDRTSRVAMDSANEILAKSFVPEGYQARAKDKSHTRYALGAMQEVDADYTRISIETAQRVGRQLDQALSDAGCPVVFRLQGSVPLNIHIRGVSDVDLLTLDSSFITYSTNGRLSQQGLYTSPTLKTSLGVLLTMRNEAEKTLRDKYPAAQVDTSGGKAIKIFGGSLARPIDVVPSHWHDTVDYQQSQNERDRAATILDKKIMRTIDNLPFLHMALIEMRDTETLGGLKKAIRLCKNVRSDAERSISLPSFDIAAAMYHSDRDALINGYAHELNILAETQRFLDFLYNNKAYARALKVPDGSRCVFDTEAKVAAIASLSLEMDNLLRDVAKEQIEPWRRKSGRCWRRVGRRSRRYTFPERSAGSSAGHGERQPLRGNWRTAEHNRTTDHAGSCSRTELVLTASAQLRRQCCSLGSVCSVTPSTLCSGHGKSTRTCRPPSRRLRGGYPRCARDRKAQSDTAGLAKI